jgi:hypothetical protein
VTLQRGDRPRGNEAVNEHYVRQFEHRFSFAFHSATWRTFALRQVNAKAAALLKNAQFIDQDQSHKATATYEFERGSTMRFFFNELDEREIQDEVGRDFAIASEAVVFAKYLAADLRCLEPRFRPALSIEVIAENADRIHSEPVFSR